MKNKKLLNKTTSSFLVYAVIILLLCAPVFYAISKWLYIYETDEVLLFHKGSFIKQSHKSYTESDIAAWNKYNRNVDIVADMGVKKDSIVSKMLFDSIANEKEPFRVLYTPVQINGKKYTYIEKSNMVEMEGMVYSIAAMFLCVIIILMIGIIWISKATAAKIWKPFYNTLEQIQDFEIDKNKAPQFIETDIDEFDRLNKSLERLIEKNTTIYKSQREFIENAAHELQTPLALFQSKIDTLFQFPDLSEEQSELLSSLNNDVSRMNRLNKNLLLLSKIDNDSYFEKTNISLNATLNRHLEFFIEQAESKHLSVNIETETDITLHSNTVLIEVLINNLFLNAIRHNVKGGKINISTTSDALTFSNTGQNTALNSEKFNRFSKSDPSSQGNGLGLAIVKKITELNNWDLVYTFDENLHHFTVKF